MENADPAKTEAIWRGWGVRLEDSLGTALVVRVKTCDTLMTICTEMESYMKELELRCPGAGTRHVSLLSLAPPL